MSSPSAITQSAAIGPPGSGPAEQIERQVAGLLDRGYVGATFREAVVAPPADRTLSVTFDDAYRSVYDNARPVLESLGVPATVFVPTALVGSERPMAWPGTDRWLGSPYEDELIPMSWNELGELTELGWELGSHTRTHPRLPTLDAEAMREELRFALRPPGAGRSELRDDRLSLRRLRRQRGGGLPASGLHRRRGAGGSGAEARTDALAAGRGLRQRRLARFRVKASPAIRRLRASHLWRARFMLRRLR